MKQASYKGFKFLVGPVGKNPFKDAVGFTNKRQMRTQMVERRHKELNVLFSFIQSFIDNTHPLFFVITFPPNTTLEAVYDNYDFRHQKAGDTMSLLLANPKFPQVEPGVMAEELFAVIFRFDTAENYVIARWLIWLGRCWQ